MKTVPKLAMLIVEDDMGLRPSLERSFTRRGHRVQCAGRVAEAVSLLRTQNIDLVLLDLQLPDGSGLDVLHAVRDLDGEIIVIMMTAFPEVKTAVHAMKEGARDFVVKPFELEELHLAVERAVEARELRRKVRRLEHERSFDDEVAEIFGDSPVIESLRDQIRKVAPSNAPVLVVGETGTGKELVADSVHRLSTRSEGPLVKMNCSAFSEQLLESELFGHEKGAFTDAKEARSGLFELAGGGTLFLDEISEMKPGLQAKLLRVVEGQPFRRVGGRREIRTDVRIVAASNRDLPERIRSNEFREDLYFRLKVFQIDVPPLRTRAQDIVLLARFFLQRSGTSLRKGPLRLLPDAEQILLTYNWPGNVRELRNVMERAAILAEDTEIRIEHLPAELRSESFIRRHMEQPRHATPSLSEIERRYIAHIVSDSGGNLSEAARVLGIARNTLKAKLQLEGEN